jgi:hypothetical protein
MMVAQDAHCADLTRQRHLGLPSKAAGRQASDIDLLERVGCMVALADLRTHA